MYNVYVMVLKTILLATSARTWAGASAGWSSPGKSLPYPSLGLVENALSTTAKDDFNGHAGAFEAAATWSGERLRHSQDETRAPHLCCAEYGQGRETFSRLKQFLSPEAVRVVSHSGDHGACFFATASRAQAAAIVEDQEQFLLESFSPFPSALKLAPGLVDHRQSHDKDEETTAGLDRLIARHGARMRMSNVEGLSIELTPGTLASRSAEAKAFIVDTLGDLMSASVDLHSTNFWSDQNMVGGEHLSFPGGAVRARDWSKAASVVHELSEAAGTSPGDICSWNRVSVHHAEVDVLLVSGLDHLLHSGRGAGGRSDGGEAAELHVACFMGLVSFLASKPEVLRVAPRQSQALLNAAARANIQSATVTDTPLTDAGLDGTGQVVQVIDSGVDESSCFFAHDESGDHVPHGHYFEEWGINPPLTSSSFSSPTSDDDDDDSWWWPWATADHHTGSYYQISEEFDGGDFTIYPDRRKIIQYINLIKSDDTEGSHGDSFTTSLGQQYPWLSADHFEYDYEAGHGTHVAGSVAGATLNTPAELISCNDTETMSCVGACVDDDEANDVDDLATPYVEIADLDRLCPLFSDYDCDVLETDKCLSDDVAETLTNNGGMAQGAKLAIFDAFYDNFGLSPFVGTGLWEPCADADCKIHSNSYGGDFECSLGPNDVLYDGWMVSNPENLLIFAAGNDGELRRSTCTIGSPAIAKNVLAVGASTSGDTRLSATPGSGIDTVAVFSSYGPTSDSRIKPEVLAPGDAIYSAASDGSMDTHSCRLWAYVGTSMSTPIVAGASAMIRQYFMNETFFATDMTARGFCDEWAGCEAFSPSSATLKALMINSANLMGESSEPDGSRGFGRIHLEAGMPLGGEGSLALFVSDSNYTSIPELTRQEYNFDVNATAGLDLRVTLSWLDPPATTFSAVQLVHDLDLVVISPNGTRYTMWASGVTDSSNVNERVIVDADDVETGTWSVWIWADNLTTDVQSYSLVVNGAISPGTGVGAIERSSSTSSTSSDGLAETAPPWETGLNTSDSDTADTSETGLSTSDPDTADTSETGLSTSDSDTADTSETGLSTSDSDTADTYTEPEEISSSDLYWDTEAPVEADSGQSGAPTAVSAWSSLCVSLMSGVLAPLSAVALAALS